MKRIKLEIGYDGTGYCGWQSQLNGTAVEEVINKKLSALLKENISVIGASRTDSGVHALANVAVFDTKTRIPAEKFSYVLNQRLPKDIIIQSSMEVPMDFHPRYCKNVKTYEYVILNRKFNIPTQRLYSYFVYKPLDFEKMQAASKYLIGEHDFKSFCSNRSSIKNTVRTIYDIEVVKQNDLIFIRVRGNGFLYNMVRIIVGTLINVGLDVYPPEYLTKILKEKDRLKAGPKVPATGLKLIGIEY
jgi:tRNA pseudouridine38-40 synthase